MANEIKSDDGAFLSWIRDHPLGLFLNVHNPPDAGYLVLHRSDCRDFKRFKATRGNQLTGGAYFKVVANSYQDISRWVSGQGFEAIFIAECQHCQPRDGATTANPARPGMSISGYGHPTHIKHGFRCYYCDFDGRAFDSWFQLTIDHAIPKSSGGSEDPGNLVTCCQACNSITSRMKFTAGTSREEALRAKRDRVRRRRAELFQYWLENVVPTWNNRPRSP
jgi:5-methylcytosine-specific restriction endonuclease McrA